MVADVAHLSEWKVDGSVLGVASRELVIQLDAFPGVQAAPIAWRRPPEPICSTPGNGCGRACSGGSVEQCTVGGREGAQAARNRGCSHCEGVGRRLSSFFLELSSEDTAAFEARVTARRAAVKGAPPSVRAPAELSKEDPDVQRSCEWFGGFVCFRKDSFWKLGLRRAVELQAFSLGSRASCLGTTRYLLRAGRQV